MERTNKLWVGVKIETKERRYAGNVIVSAKSWTKAVSCLRKMGYRINKYQVIPYPVYEYFSTNDILISKPKEHLLSKGEIMTEAQNGVYITFNGYDFDLRYSSNRKNFAIFTGTYGQCWHTYNNIYVMGYMNNIDKNYACTNLEDVL